MWEFLLPNINLGRGSKLFCENELSMTIFYRFSNNFCMCYLPETPHGGRAVVSNQPVYASCRRRINSLGKMRRVLFLIGQPIQPNFQCVVPDAIYVPQSSHKPWGRGQYTRLLPVSFPVGVTMERDLEPLCAGNLNFRHPIFGYIEQPIRNENSIHLWQAVCPRTEPR